MKSVNCGLFKITKNLKLMDDQSVACYDQKSDQLPKISVPRKNNLDLVNAGEYMPIELVDFLLKINLSKETQVGSANYTKVSFFSRLIWFAIVNKHRFVVKVATKKHNAQKIIFFDKDRYYEHKATLYVV